LPTTQTHAMTLGQNSVPGLSLGFQLPPQLLWNMNQGEGANDRNGRSLYIKGTTCTHKFEYAPNRLDIDSQTLPFQGPILTRFMVVQPRTALHGRLHQWDVTRDLFLDNFGNQKGISALQTDFELTQWNINVKDYIVLKDMKFCLSPANLSQLKSHAVPVSTDPTIDNQVTVIGQPSQRYPSYKLIKHYIPMSRTVRYTGAEGQNPGPDNINTEYCVLAVSAPVGVANMPTGTTPLQVNLRYSFMGTTACLDL